MSPQSSSSSGRSYLAWPSAALGLPTGSRGSGTGHSPRPWAPMGFGGRGRYVLGAVNQWAATGRTEFEQRCIRERRHEETCDGPANCSGVTRGFLTLAVGCGRIGRGLGNTRSERGQQHSECKPRRTVAMTHPLRANPDTLACVTDMYWVRAPLMRDLGQIARRDSAWCTNRRMRTS